MHRRTGRRQARALPAPIRLRRNCLACLIANVGRFWGYVKKFRCPPRGARKTNRGLSPRCCHPAPAAVRTPAARTSGRLAPGKANTHPISFAVLARRCCLVNWSLVLWSLVPWSLVPWSLVLWSFGILSCNGQWPTTRTAGLPRPLKWYYRLPATPSADARVASPRLSGGLHCR